METEVGTTPANDSQARARLAEQVSSLFTSMVQALRALQFYGSTNLTTQRAVEALRSGFEQIWTTSQELDVRLEPDTIVMGDLPVYQNANHTDSLAFLMFRDGIRTLSFRQGFEQEELVRFLQVLHRARYTPTDADDLVTLLWDEDFLHLRHGYIDAEMTTQDAAALESEVRAATSAAADRNRSLVMHIHDASTRAISHAGYDPRAYPGAADPPSLPVGTATLERRTLQLDPETLVYLQRELEEEIRRDVQVDVVNALFDILEDPDPRAQSEVVAAFGTLLPQLLAVRQMRLIAETLTELRDLADRPELLDATRREELDAMIVGLTNSGAVDEFLEAVEGGDVQADLEHVENLVAHLGGAILQRLLRARERASGKELRAALESATESIAKRDPEALRSALHADDAHVVRGALRILVGLGVADAVHETIRLLDHADTRVRLGAVEVLVATGDKAGLDALVRAREDVAQEVRVAAAWGLATWQHGPALGSLQRSIEAKTFDDMHSDEKMAILDAYARIGSGGALDLLGRLLHAKSLLRHKEPTDVRAYAARALGLVGSADAKQLLERAKGDRDPEVRRAVQRSLRKMGTS